MNLSAPGAAFLRGLEGFVDHWYADSGGVGTIGIGFTWRSASFRQWWATNKPSTAFGPGATMTRAEADAALTVIVSAEYGKAVNDFFGPVAVPQHVFDGTVSPVYNAGAGTLTDKWAKALKAGDVGDAATLLKATRVTAKGKRLSGLVNRRRDEAELMQSGDYVIGAFVPDPLADGELRKGERGPAVEQLQRDLAMAKLYTGLVDGIFGYGTEAAVLAFQRSAGLAADGVAGPKTLAVLAAVLRPAPMAPAPGAPFPVPAKAQPAPKSGWDILFDLIAGMLGAMLKH